MEHLDVPRIVGLAWVDMIGLAEDVHSVVGVFELFVISTIYLI